VQQVIRHASDEPMHAAQRPSALAIPSSWQLFHSLNGAAGTLSQKLKKRVRYLGLLSPCEELLAPKLCLISEFIESQAVAACLFEEHFWRLSHAFQKKMFNFRQQQPFFVCKRVNSCVLCFKGPVAKPRSFFQLGVHAREPLMRT
jgi:hypothetical protein